MGDARLLAPPLPRRSPPRRPPPRTMSCDGAAPRVPTSRGEGSFIGSRSSPQHRHGKDMEKEGKRKRKHKKQRHGNEEAAAVETAALRHTPSRHAHGTITTAPIAPPDPAASLSSVLQPPPPVPRRFRHSIVAPVVESEEPEQLQYQQPFTPFASAQWDAGQHYHRPHQHHPHCDDDAETPHRGAGWRVPPPLIDSPIRATAAASTPFRQSPVHRTHRRASSNSSNGHHGIIPRYAREPPQAGWRGGRTVVAPPPPPPAPPVFSAVPGEREGAPRAWATAGADEDAETATPSATVTVCVRICAAEWRYATAGPCDGLLEEVQLTDVLVDVVPTRDLLHAVESQLTFLPAGSGGDTVGVLRFYRDDNAHLGAAVAEEVPAIAFMKRDETLARVLDARQVAARQHRRLRDVDVRLRWFEEPLTGRYSMLTELQQHPSRRSPSRHIDVVAISPPPRSYVPPPPYHFGASASTSDSLISPDSGRRPRRATGVGGSRRSSVSMAGMRADHGAGLPPGMATHPLYSRPGGAGGDTHPYEDGHRPPRRAGERGGDHHHHYYNDYSDDTGRGRTGIYRGSPTRSDREGYRRPLSDRPDAYMTSAW